MGAIVSAENKPPVQGAASAQYLTFALGGETYALSILNIKEIIEYGHLTEVPMMPGFIRGVINLRGRVVPVVDLAARFGRGATQVQRRTSIIMIEVKTASPDASDAGSEHQDIGVMVDAVNEVVDIDAADIEPPPNFGTRIRPEFISGMAKHGNAFTIVLDVNRVLSVDEMSALGQAQFAGSEGQAG